MEKKENKFFGGKKTKWIFIFGIIVIIIIIFIFNKRNDIGPAYATVTRGDVLSEVSVTGTVVPSKNIALAFEKTGRITRIPVKVGSEVATGQTLVQLENSDLRAQVAQAEANLGGQQARLDELKRGTREEEIKIKEAELAKAEQDLENYYIGIRDLLNDSYAKADDSVRAKTDSLFTDDETQNPKLTFSVSDLQSQIDIVALRIRAGSELNLWKKELQTVNSSTPNKELEMALVNGKNHLAIVRDYLSRAMDAVDSSVGLSASTVSTYKTDINTGRVSVNTAFTTLSNQSQLIASQKVTVQKTKDELSLKNAGATVEQIATQEAQVAEARANVLYYESQLNKTYLRAPFSGVITKIDVELGDIVSANTPAISLIGSGNFQVETNVAESDVAKIKIGDTAIVTLDAYGNEVTFQAVVFEKNLSETIIDGVSAYKTTLQFQTNDKKILPGLTANVKILTDKRENVLFVPSRSIISKEGKKFVLYLEKDNTSKEISVVIGLRGSNGRTEILSGISESDRVVSE
jgi:HlyD family secretion protein